MTNDPFERILVELFQTSHAVSQAMLRAWSPTAEHIGRALTDDGASMPRNDPQDASNTVTQHDEKLVISRLDDVAHDLPMGISMYNLQKAKEEIDAVAKHATDLAAHVLVMAEGMETKLEAFKTELLGALDRKFSDLERTILGG